MNAKLREVHAALDVTTIETQELIVTPIQGDAGVRAGIPVYENTLAKAHGEHGPGLAVDFQFEPLAAAVGNIAGPTQRTH